MNVKNIIGEPLKIMGVSGGTELEKKVLELLAKVGLKPEHLKRHPHTFSGDKGNE